MSNKIPLDPKIWQLMECVIPNLIGLYINSYLGCALSVICLVWHWTKDKTDRTSPPRQKAIALLLLSAIAVWGVRGSGFGVPGPSSGMTDPALRAVPQNTTPGDPRTKTRFLDTVET